MSDDIRMDRTDKSQLQVNAYMFTHYTLENKCHVIERAKKHKFTGMRKSH